LTNQQINSVVVNSKHSYKFVYYLLRAYDSVIFSYNSGIDTPIVPKSVFEGIKVRVPCRDSQRRIAAVLSAYDDLIENNRRRIALLERMAEQLYREWFVRFRFPGYQQAKFAKGLPVDWELSTLGEIATFVMGQSPSSEFYNESGEGLPFHQGVGTYGSRFPNNIVFCSVDGRKAKVGDILFSVRAPVGRLNIADCDMIIGRGLAAIRHKQGFNSYLFNLLKVAFANEDIIGNGAIFNSVGKDELSKFAVFSPPQPLVRRFDEMACSIEKQLEVLTESIRNLVKTRDLLLPRLISGKLRVDDLDIQFPPSMQTERA
jgi:type I restriction enzyme S subunit